jgi:hypothetical protein
MKPTLPLQPRPIDLLVLHESGPEGPSTRIARLWAKGDAARCRLCPKHLCRVSPHGMCMVKVPCNVPDHLAALFPLLSGIGEPDAGAGVYNLRDGS